MPDTPDNVVNHGLLRPSHLPLAGTVPFVVRNPSGNWTPYLPEGEKQANPYETWSCVSQSAVNSIEAQEFFLTGKRVQYSKRWLAKLSGTTNQGNYLGTVANTIMRYGLVLESSWPAPYGLTFDQYYAEPTPLERQILLAEGANWLKTHKVQADWTTTQLNDLLQYLQQCPIQTTIPGHAIVDFYSQQELQNYLDSYEPFRKTTNRSNLLDAYKIILTIKKMRLVNDNGTIFLVGDLGKIGFADMSALDQIKALTSEPIENGSTTGIPQLKIMETGYTFHD